MYHKFCTILVMIVLVNTILKAADDKVKFTGYGSTGLKVYNERFSQQTYYEGKFQAEINLKKGIEAQLDFRGNSTDNAVDLREFSIKFEVTDKLNLRVGNIKKPFSYEYLTSREELYTVERSLLVQNMAIRGYGGRSVSVMAYHKYKKKTPEFPFSYYVSAYKNNSFSSGLVTRGEYHYKDYSIALTYMLHSRGGWVGDNFHGAGIDLMFEKNKYFANLNVMAAQDPEVSKQRREQLNRDDEVVYGLGSTVIAAKTFILDKRVVYGLEPVLSWSIYIPDSNEIKRHINNTIIGVNIYFTKDVRLRIHGDLRLTRDKYFDTFNNEYSKNRSGYIVDLQVRY